MSTDPAARARATGECARLTWQYGTTYFWGALLLPRRQRKHVYAVYALCRLADDIVDLPEPSPSKRRASALSPSSGATAAGVRRPRSAPR